MAGPSIEPYETLRIPCGGGVHLAVDRWSRPQAHEPAVAPGFLLVHGLASNARLYDGVAERLATSGHAVASLDLRGHGRSDKPDSGYDYDTLSADLVAVIDALGSSDDAFARPVAVGQSFGANLVLELAARSPELVSGVACIDGGTIDLGARFATFDEVTAALAPPKLAGASADAIRRMIASSHPDWPAQGIDATMANFEIHPDGTITPWLSFERHLEILRTMWSSSPTRLYRLISVPVLLGHRQPGARRSEKASSRPRRRWPAHASTGSRPRTMTCTLSTRRKWPRRLWARWRTVSSRRDARRAGGSALRARRQRGPLLAHVARVPEVVVRLGP